MTTKSYVLESCSIWFEMIRLPYMFPFSHQLFKNSSSTSFCFIIMFF